MLNVYIIVGCSETKLRSVWSEVYHSFYFYIVRLKGFGYKRGRQTTNSGSLELLKLTLPVGKMRLECVVDLSERFLLVSMQRKLAAGKESMTSLKISSTKSRVGDKQLAIKFTLKIKRRLICTVYEAS